MKKKEFAEQLVRHRERMLVITYEAEDLSQAER